MNELDIVEVYRRRRKWRWRYKAAGNFKILATGAEGYDNLDDLANSLARVLHLAKEIDLRAAQQRVRRNSDWPEVLVVIIP